MAQLSPSLFFSYNGCLYFAGGEQVPLLPLFENINISNIVQQGGLNRATLEFQVRKILSIAKISKLDPSISKICCQKNWLNFDKVCINLTSSDLTRPDLTNPHLT